MANKPKVLLIEDESLVANLYERTFTLNEFEVEIATDGAKGLKALTEAAALPDVVVLDLMLPEMSGFDVLRELKKNPKTKSVPVVVLSNLAQTSDVEETKKLGADLHLVKSQNDPSELVEKIKGVIAKK